MWHSLVDHSADVAAVFEAMLRVPIVDARLSALANVATTHTVWRQRISAHVALHDFGKANRGFRQRWRATAPPIGHIAPAVGLLYSGEFSEELVTALPVEKMIGWGAWESAFLSIVAHHGRPQVATRTATTSTPCAAIRRSSSRAGAVPRPAPT